MKKEERSIFVGRISTIEGIVRIAKGFYVNVEIIYKNVRDDMAVVAISGRLPEMLHLKNALPTLRKEGNVYSV